MVGAAALRLTGTGGLVGQFLSIWVFTNVLLTAFHIIPVPPLDASKILARFLPARARSVYESWEPYGALFVLAILFLLPSPILGIVDGAALLWGADSRDGRDWRREPRLDAPVRRRSR